MDAFEVLSASCLWFSHRPGAETGRRGSQAASSPEVAGCRPQPAAPCGAPLRGGDLVPLAPVSMPGLLVACWKSFVYFEKEKNVVAALKRGTSVM